MALLRGVLGLNHRSTTTFRYQNRFLPIILGLLVGCIGLNGPLRQYFSLYRAVSQREGERKEK